MRILETSLRRRPLLAVGIVLFSCCNGNQSPISPGPTPSPLAVSFDTPVPAVFIDATQVFIAEFPVRLRRTEGGTLESLETVVRNQSRNMEIARNRRPNEDFSFPDIHIPPGGVLTVQAGVGFPPPPPRDQLTITVIARLTTGVTGEASGPLTTVFP